MKIRLLLLACLALVSASLHGQETAGGGGAGIRATNAPFVGAIPQVASTGPLRYVYVESTNVSGPSTLPSYALTNNQSTPSTFVGNVTNAGDVQLTGGAIRIGSGAGSGLYVSGQTRTGTGVVTNALTMLNATGSRPAVFDSAGRLTNDLPQVNSWRVWADPVTSGQYYAQNKGIDLNLSSNDFSGLLQNIFNRGVDGTFLKIASSPYFTNNYTLTNTVTITNAFIMEGDGNSTTVLRLATNSAGPMFQFGTVGNPLNGIARVRKLRFEGDPGTAAGVGVRVVNCAEPVFSDSEWTGFKLAGIQVSETNYNHWALAERCWFVGKDATAHGILFDREGTGPSQNHFTINECIFGSFGGMVHGITVSNYYPNLVIQDNHFRYSSGTVVGGIGILAGGRFLIQGNQFVNYSGSQYPILFYDRGSATNYSSSVVNNYASRSGGAGPSYAIVLGDFVQGIFMSGNASEGGEAVGFTGNNGSVNNFDAYGLLMGTVTGSRAAIFDAQNNLTNSPVTATELGYVSGVTNAIQAQIQSQSNRVVVVGGTGGITVDVSGSANTMTFTVNDDDAGGGSASAVGGNRAIQYATNGTSLGGTDQFQYDPTNSRVGLNLSGRIPRVGLELGGSTTQGTMYLGAGAATNSIYYSGVRTISPQDLILGVQAGYNWHIDNDDGALHPPAAVPLNLGSVDANVHTLHTRFVSNYTATLISGTIYGTNQYYTTNVVGNLTMADSGLLPNIPYFVSLSNAANTVSAPGTWVYPDIPSGLTPNFQGGQYELEVKVQFGRTNAWVRKGPANDLLFGSLHLAASTNNGLVVLQVTNFTGSGAIMASNAPLVLNPGLIATNGNHAYLRASPSNAAPVTNFFGQVEFAHASVVIIDGLISREWIQTNRLAAATTFVLTNYTKGAKFRIVVPAEASGGTDRLVTVVPKSGDLIANYVELSTNLATALVLTHTNGQIAELDLAADFSLGTNIVGAVYGRAKR